MLKEVRGILASWKREKNREAYDESVKTAQAALVKGYYDEAERQANLALVSQPGDQAALQILSRAKENRVAREAEMDVEPATALTVSRVQFQASRSGLGDEPGFSSPVLHLPMLRLIIEFEVAGPGDLKPSQFL